MTDDIVSFETAKLLREIDFNWKVRHAYGHGCDLLSFFEILILATAIVRKKLGLPSDKMK